MSSLHELESIIGHQFSNTELLTRALTHYSHVYESLPPGSPRTVLRDNEQLEFLGDAILGFVVSEWLVSRFPDYSEGKLSERKAHLVSAAHLVEVARALDIGRFLFLGKGEEMSGGRQKRAMLSDALEALIAAVYLDGGIAAAHSFVLRCVLTDEAVGAGGDLNGRPDYKTSLQELARSRKLSMPRYEVARETGPDHAKIFTVQVTVGPELCAQGEGSTKKSASQRAARKVFEMLSPPE
ncbi:MAG: RNAse [Bryobacterales bacterium]|nr:RNAse [Bryobacterales bacterium]